MPANYRQAMILILQQPHKAATSAYCAYASCRTAKPFEQGTYPEHRGHLLHMARSGKMTGVSFVMHG
jgi:hypothetical protein